MKEIAHERKIPFDQIEEIMFGDDHLLPTVLDSEVVKAVWENEFLNQNKELIIDLIEEFSEEARRGNFKITKIKWLEHIEKMWKVEKYPF